VVDRVGGGDGYAAGFFYGLLSARPSRKRSTWLAHGALLTTFPATRQWQLPSKSRVRQGRLARIHANERNLSMAQADIAMIGLAVMGQNLVMNMADHGFTVAVYNRTISVVDDFVNVRRGMRIVPTHSLEEMVAALKRPAGDDAGEGRPAGGRLDLEVIPLLERATSSLTAATEL